MNANENLVNEVFEIELKKHSKLIEDLAMIKKAKKGSYYDIPRAGRPS
jgi:hypothetical protein